MSYPNKTSTGDCDIFTVKVKYKTSYHVLVSIETQPVTRDEISAADLRSTGIPTPLSLFIPYEQIIQILAYPSGKL